MKYFIAFIALLLLSWFTYSEYVNPVMLQEKWNEAKEIDTQVETFEQSIRNLLQEEAQYQATRKECWFFDKKCKEDYTTETKFTKKYFVGLLNKLQLMKREKQTNIWNLYNECANWEWECWVRPARVDLLFHWPEKDAQASYAYEISWYNKDFILTMLAENNQWDVRTIWVTNDRWLCQISPYYHPHITNHPNFFDPYWQIQKCRELYSGWTRFYWYDVRSRRIWEVRFY